MSGSEESTASQKASFLAHMLCKLTDMILRGLGTFFLFDDILLGEEQSMGEPGFNSVVLLLGEFEILGSGDTRGSRFDNGSKRLLDSAVCEAARDDEML